jgi:hypothetical protein
VKYLALPVGDRFKLVSYAFLLLLVHIALSWFGYQKVYAFLASHPGKRDIFPGQAEKALDKAKHCAFLVSVAAQYGFFRATCLRQALLVFWLLRCRGIFTELRIGVRREGKSVIAHAWLKYGEAVISEGSQVEKNFTAFKDLPGGQ